MDSTITGMLFVSHFLIVESVNSIISGRTSNSNQLLKALHNAYMALMEAAQDHFNVVLVIHSGFIDRDDPDTPEMSFKNIVYNQLKYGVEAQVQKLSHQHKATIY